MLSSKEINRLLLHLNCHDIEKSTLAFRRLYEYYFHRLIRYAIIKTGNKTDAEDMVQDIMVAFWTHRSRLPELEIDTKEKLDYYFFGAVNGAVKNYRKKMSTVSLDEIYAQEEELLHFFEVANDVSLEAREFENIIFNKLKERLPYHLRQVFFLTKEKGYTLKDTARALGISESTAKKYKKTLMQHIENETDMYFGLKKKT